MSELTLDAPATEIVQDAVNAHAVRGLAADASTFSLELADVAANVKAVSDAAISQGAAFEQTRASTAELLSTTHV